MGESYKPITSMKEVPEQLRKLRRQYLRYQQAEIIYSISHKKLLELASDADQTEVNLEEKSKVEQQTVNQTEQKPEKKTSIRKQLAEKKKECEERDAKQQTVRKKRNYDMSL